MSKLSNIITMIDLLNTGKKYSVNELADILEVTPRMIRTYKEDLEKCGFYIDTVYGPFGGYVLNRKVKLPQRKFKKDDYDFLINLNVSKENKIRLEGIADKIRGLSVETDEVLITNEIRNHYNSLTRAIKDGKKVSISYKSFTKGLTKRIIHPFDMFYTSNGWAVSAYCELRCDLRLFELNRIEELNVLDESFE